MKYSNSYYKIITIIIVLFASNSHSQQDPQFTHYMYNMSILNPAYTSAEESVLNLGVFYRSQWVGLEGAPQTGSFFGRTSINEKIQIGLSFINDNVGETINENNLNADFAYTLPISDNSKLSFGLKAGVTLFKSNFDGFNLQSGTNDTDIAFNENINKTLPNIGVGAFYFSNNYYLGLSSTNLLKQQHLDSENGIEAIGYENIHYFLTGGYIFELNNNFKLKPSFLVKAVEGAPVGIDLSTNVLVYEKLELGASYRLDDSINALANFRVSPKLRIGYSYDYTTSNLGNFNSGSHEIFILFDIDLFGLGSYDTSPRFF